MYKYVKRSKSDLITKYFFLKMVRKPYCDIEIYNLSHIFDPSVICDSSKAILLLRFIPFVSVFPLFHFIKESLMTTCWERPLTPWLSICSVLLYVIFILSLVSGTECGI